MAEFLKDVCERILVSVLDAIEAAISGMSDVAGKQMTRVLVDTVFLMVLSIVCEYMGQFTFISKEEAGVAVVIATALTIINRTSLNEVNKVKSMIKSVSLREVRRKRK